MLILHPHLHRRRTGVTTHTEAVVAGLAISQEAYAIGPAIAPGIPKLSMREALRRIRSGEPTIWHAHRNLELLLGLRLRASRKSKLWVVATRHSGSRPGAYSRWLLHAADACVSLTAHQAFLLGVRSTVIPHGIDTGRFVPAPDGRAAAAARAQIPTAYALGVVGRLRPSKGQGDFAEALADTPQAVRQNWTPVLVGLAKPRDARWANGLVARVPQLVLAGAQSDPVPFYQAFTIAVAPTRDRVESFGLAAIEAMACGCAVVATRLPWMPDLIDDGRTGFLYPPGDVPALRALLARLMANPERTAAVGQAAAAAVRERFGIERELAGLRALYQNGFGHCSNSPWELHERR